MDMLYESPVELSQRVVVSNFIVTNLETLTSSRDVDLLKLIEIA